MSKLYPVLAIRVFLLLFVLTIFLAEQVYACSCMHEAFSPFLSRGLLPSNAKGVLYYNRPPFGTGDFSSNSVVLFDVMPELRPDFFKVIDITENKSVEIEIKQIDISYLDPIESGKRYLISKDDSKRECFYGSSDAEACKYFQDFISKSENMNDWVAKLLISGHLIDVTAKVGKRHGLFRIEPKNGFKSGHTYTFKAGESAKAGDSDSNYDWKKVALPVGQVSITIAQQPLKLPPKPVQSILISGTDSLSQISIPSSGSCSEVVVGEVREISYQMPKELEPYKESINYFTLFAKRDQTGSEVNMQNLAYSPWIYHSSSCSSVNFGKSELGFGKDKLYAPCHVEPYLPRHGFEAGFSFSVKGYFGLLEVDEAFIESEEKILNFKKREVSECSTTNVLTKALETNDHEELKKEICKFGTSFRGRFDDEPNPEKLLHLISQFIDSTDIEVQRCAVTSLSHIGYQLQQLKSNESLEELSKIVIPKLFQIAKTNNVIQIRNSALGAISSIAIVLLKKSAILGASLEAGVPVLSQILEDHDPSIRNVAAEIMGNLGSSAKEGVPSLVKAIKDKSKPTYQATTALAKIDPFNVELIPALIIALGSGEHSVKSSSARALGKVGAFDDRVVPALMEAAKSNNLDAIEALGELGQQSVSATALLGEIAEKAPHSYLREAAKSALGKIK